MPKGSNTSAENGALDVVRKIGRTLHGFVAGLLAGAIVGLGIVVARARFFGHFFHDPTDALGWPALPAALLVGAGAWLGWHRPRLLGRAVLGAIAGLATGIGLGVGVGAVVSDASGMWAGAVLGAGLGVVVGGVGAYVWAVESDWWEGTADSPVEPGATRAARWAGSLLVLTFLGIGALEPGVAPAPTDPELAVPLPDTADVERVVYFLGDPGNALPATSPVMAALRADVEEWAAALSADSSVVVAVLGDLIYPSGMSDTTSAARERDTLVIRAQMDLVDGPAGREHHARLVLIPGNHDWGEHPGYGGVVHLELLAEFVERHAEAGRHVTLAPAPGTGGPRILDLGRHLRLVILDSAWWLLGADDEEKERLLTAVGDALMGADGRRTVVAAHHPFESGGPHGALVSFAGVTGLRMITSKSGAMLQDLHSGPYRRLRAGLLDVFDRVGPPDLFAGGHEHSLQVLRNAGPPEPPTTLVSGSGSKLTEVGYAPGMRIGRAEPGYARLFVLRDGRLVLSVEATPAEFLSCPDDETRARCIGRGVASFRTVWSDTLPAPER